MTYCLSRAGKRGRHTLCMPAMEMIAPDRATAGRKTIRPGALLSLPPQRHASTVAYYNDHAEAYTALTLGIDTAKSIARFAALLPKNGLVLDAGCGSGRDLIGLKAAGLRPEGLDVSPSLAAIARAYSGARVTIGDLRGPHFAPATFDGIWAMASLLHIAADEIYAVLQELCRTLVPGGVLFASVKRGKGTTQDANGRWFTLHDEAGWEVHMRAAGFEIIEIVGEPPSIGGTGTVAQGWISSLVRRPA